MRKKVTSLIMLLLLISALPTTSLLLSSTVYAHDPGIYVPEKSGHYSTLSTWDNKQIEDYTFASYINSYIIPKGFHTMIFVFGQCFGGGFIDNVVKFGENHTLPVVAMSASMFNESSWGSTASGGEDHFLREFANAIDAYDGTNPNTAPSMWDAYSKAKTNDPCGPNGTDHGSCPEHPMLRTLGILPVFPSLGNACFPLGVKSWKAILWVGNANCERFWNDVNHIHKVLVQKYGFRDVEDIYVMFGPGKWLGSNTLKDGGKIDSTANKADMESAIKNWLAPRMNNDTQFFFWSSDHGGEGQTIREAAAPLGAYPFSLDSSFIDYMRISTENIPYIYIETFNVLSPNNKVYLNGYLLGNLTPTGTGGRGNDTFYFDDNVVPLYSDTDNIITFEWSQHPEPYEVANVSICTGGIATLTTPIPVGGIWTPADKFGLLVPYLGLASTLIVATVATAIYIKRVKHRKEKQ